MRRFGMTRAVQESLIISTITAQINLDRGEHTEVDYGDNLSPRRLIRT